MAGFVQTNQRLKLEYSATTINTADTGKIFLTPQTAGAVGVIYTLPTAAAGLHYRFCNSATNALSGTVTITAAANSLYGSVITGPTNGVSLLAVFGSTSINFLTATSLFGDFIDLYCSGSNWMVDARSQVAGGITVV